MKALAHLNKYILKYKWRFLLGIVFVTISNIFAVFAPQVIRDAFDLLATLAEDDSTYGDEVAVAALTLAGLYMLWAILKGFFLFLTRQTLIIMSRLIEYDLKNEVFDHYQALSQNFYKQNSTGDLMNRISEDVSRVRMYLGPAIMYTINLAVLSILVVSTMLSVNAELTLYVLAPLPIMSVCIYYVSSVINKKSELVQRQQSQLSTFVQEAFSGIRVLKAYHREEARSEAFNEECEAYKQRSLDLVKVNALFHPFIILLIGLSTVLTILIGGLKVIDGTAGITVGNIAEFVVYVNMLTWPFASVGWVTSLVQRAAASQERINEFLKQEPEIKNPTEEPLDLKGEVEFDRISFTYQNTGLTALKDISFRIEPGKSLAILGKTGSGKSTIAALLCRHYDASEGQVLIDGRPIQELNLTELRQGIGYVPQDVFLFSDTIHDNIAFGLPKADASEEKVHQAAKDAAIYDNIMEFSAQFQTILGERGITLSGGQKQRVSIARAIIKEPQILIFDDCLSAVDTETEEEILANLRRLMKGKTTVLISHRVSTAKDADEIIVLDDGKIIEKGTHESLLSKHGSYFDLYHKQLLENEKIIG